MSVGQTITVVVPAGPPPTTVPVASAGSTVVTAVSGTLPHTGAPLLPVLLALAIGLIVAGRMLLGVSARVRRSADRRSGVLGALGATDAARVATGTSGGTLASGRR